MTDTLESVQKNYPAINAAAGEFLGRLTGTSITRDIMLSAGLAGLMLLRESSADLQKIPSGTVVLGAVSDSASQTLTRFVYSVAMSNGLSAKEIEFAAIPADAKDYLPELTRFEQPLYDVCKKHSIEKGSFPFVAAASAVKLVLAGKQLRLLDAKIGMTILSFHIVGGSKTAPYPVPSAK